MYFWDCVDVTNIVYKWLLYIIMYCTVNTTILVSIKEGYRYSPKHHRNKVGKAVSQTLFSVFS